MRSLPSVRRLAASGLTALAGLLLAVATQSAGAAEGVARVSDSATANGPNGIVQTSHTETCTTDATGGDARCEGCGAGCACGSGCKCANGGCCGKKGGLLGGLFGGKRGKDCKCGSGCKCSKSGCRMHLADLNGDGNADSIGTGYCRGCGKWNSLYGQGYCYGCCGLSQCGVPCLGIPCLGFPCLGMPVPGCFAGQNGAIGGTYARVYALNPYYHDFRDGAVYAAQGYNAPIAVPLAPNVDYQWNYGWGMPSSRITPVSRVVPSPYGPQPQFAVPPGYMPAESPLAPQMTPPAAPPAPAP